MSTPDLLKPYISPKKPLKFRPDGSFKICCFSDLHQTIDYDKRTLAAMHAIIEREQPTPQTFKVLEAKSIKKDDSNDGSLISYILGG